MTELNHFIHHTNTQLNKHDLVAPRREWLITPPKFITNLILCILKDKRDLPICQLFLNVILITIPLSLIVFQFENPQLGFIYTITNLILFQERFILALHFSSHRWLTDQTIINLIPSQLLSPLFGIPSGMYFLHHVVMHHHENNVYPWDVSSTEPYQRDSVIHFIQYWIRFLIAIWVELPYYAFMRKRYKMAISCSTCILTCLSSYYQLYQVQPVGTLWVFIIPTIVGSFLLMFGNWSQHIFINPANPSSNQHLTYNIINSPNNQTTFNDGQHIEHHLQARRHWSELPDEFNKKLDVQKKEKAVIFDGLDFIGVGFLTFFGRQDILTAKLVQLSDEKLNSKDAEIMLRSKLVPVHRNDGSRNH